ncbi:MAG: hypothetical protein KKA12_08140 [Alphaproteobacteria bacterium]|nr:hypothetical protein [Alphaproteobacteria bacterium]
MAKRNSRKQVLKAFVLTIGVADCAGIYVVNSRLSAPVPDDLRFDLAYALPADQGVFRPDHANRQSFAMAPTTAVPQETTLPEPRSAAQPAPVVPLVPAPSSSRAVALNEPVAPELARSPAVAPAPAGTVTTALKAPAVRLPVPATALFKSSVAAAADDRPVREKTAKAAKAAGLAALDRPSASKLVPTIGAGRSASGAALRNLVPAPRQETLFAAAFATLDAPIEAGQLLQEAVLAQSAPAGGATPDVGLAHNNTGAPAARDETRSDAPARMPGAELPAVSAPFTAPSA